MFEYYGYPDEYMYDFSSMATSVFQTALGFTFIVMLLVSVISVITYLFSSMAIYQIAQKRGIPYAIFAFIPVCRDLIFGAVADDINKTMNKRSNFAAKLIALNVIVSTLSVTVSIFMLLFVAMEMIGMVMLSYLFVFVIEGVAICYIVYYYMALYRIFKEYAHSSAVLFEILSIFFGIDAFILFAIRNNKSGYQLWKEDMECEREKAEHPEKFMDGYTNFVATSTNENPET